MILAMRSRAIALLILCICNLAIADRRAIHLHRRDGPTTPSITETDSKASSSPTKSAGKNEGDSTTSRVAKITSASNSTSSSAAATPTIIISAVTSDINGAAPTSTFNHDSTFNSTLTPGKLPLTPEVTPGFAVGGVFLMISGVAYTLVGIKNKWLHIFISAAYLASLSVTVLILYVMNPPISNAIQGAYVVAIIMTGLVLGGAAIVFKELTEGLGCLLGGFCLSMWLLVLKPGGLLTTTGGICGFIAAFTLAAFATSFSHVTRPYGLIVSISFAGATAVVLGIDCVSRAGLKEFWAYLFNLNDALFPLGATTYPLTRGLRVEIAAIIIIFLAGVVSQMKLWKVIEKRREQRAAERLEDERTLQQEEANVGNRVETQNARDRNQWETIYGDKEAIASTEHTSRDSGVGDMESKKGPKSTVTSRPSGEEEIEMADMSPTLTTGAGLVMTNKDQDNGAVTVRVARDVHVPQILDEFGLPVADGHMQQHKTEAPPQEEVWVVGSDGEAHLEKRASPRNSKRVSSGPEVIPLPFKVPQEDIEDDRSSIATFADDDEVGQKRKSLRLSTGSALLRSISKRSMRNSKRYSGKGNSTDDLVIPNEVEDDRRSSVAATMDGLSDDEDMRSVRSSIRSIEDLSVAKDQLESNKPQEDTSTGLDPEIVPRPISAATVGTNILEEPKEERSKKVSSTSSTDPKAEPERVAPEVTGHNILESLKEGKSEKVSLTSSTDPNAETEAATPQVQSEKPSSPSVVSVVDSKPASITKDRLPAQLSKVVMSYRTNEWAKHLSGAEAPDLDELHLEEYPTEEAETNEVAAPVNMKELQQTPENALPPPARSTSQRTGHAPSPLSSSSPSTSRPQTSHGNHQEGPISRSASQQSFHSQSGHLNTRALSLRNSSSPNIPQPIVESPIEEEYSLSNSPNIPGTSRFSTPNTPFGSSNTLIGKRDTMLRNKSFYTNQPALASTPEFPNQSTNPSSESGSIYNSSPADDDNMSLSARRDLIRQSSLQSLISHQQNPASFDTHQPRRLSSAPHPVVREQQLASWRASVQNDMQSTVQPRAAIERQRSALWHERQAEEAKKAMEQKRRVARDSAFDERMRRGDMLDAHREALRKMQASANKHVA